MSWTTQKTVNHVNENMDVYTEENDNNNNSNAAEAAIQKEDIINNDKKTANQNGDNNTNTATQEKTDASDDEVAKLGGGYCESPRCKAYRNVFGTGVSFMMSLSAVVSLFSLQSSINPDLGLASLTVFMVFFLISGLLFASTIIHILGTKFTLIFSYCLLGMYTLANFYPDWYTLIPMAALGGIGFSPVFVAANVHVTTIAIRYASALNERKDYLVALFAGIQAMFFKVAYIPGSFATAAILFSERISNGSEIIDANLSDVCNNTEALELDRTYIYILLSVYIFFDIIAIIICALFLDRLQVNMCKLQSCSKIWKIFIRKPILGTLKMFLCWKMYMIIPLMVLDGYLASFALGTYYKVFVSDCIGIHWVGMVTALFGICSGFSAMIGGRLVKCIPQFVIVYIISVGLVSLMLFLIFWEREPSYALAFTGIAIWGICEGMWHSVPPSLVGNLFHKKHESAFSVSRMGLATGMMLGFSTALLLEYQYLLWITISFLCISVVTYSVLVFKTQTKHQLFPACYKEKTKQEEAQEEEEYVEKEDSLVEAVITENVF